MLGRHVAKYGTYEPALTAWISTYLSACPSGIFVDVGANIGWHAIHAAQHRTVETIVAFEPHLFNAGLLDRNLYLNRVENAIVVACAVGAYRGSVRLYQYKASNLGRHSVLVDYGRGSRTVPLTDLDSILDDLGLGAIPVLLLKIDVEGYEPAVLRGAPRTLRRTRAVVIEYSPNLSAMADLPTGEMLDQLRAAGFVPHSFDCEGRLSEIGTNDLLSVRGQVDLVWLLERPDAQDGGPTR